MFFAEVPDCIQGVQEEHSGSCKPHCLFNALAHIFLVAVNGAISTGGFLFAKGASFQSLHRVPFQFLAFLTKLFARVPIQAMAERQWVAIILLTTFSLLIHPYNPTLPIYQNKCVINLTQIPDFCKCKLAIFLLVANNDEELSFVLGAAVKIFNNKIDPTRSFFDGVPFVELMTTVSFNHVAGDLKARDDGPPPVGAQ